MKKQDSQQFINVNIIYLINEFEMLDRLVRFHKTLMEGEQKDLF